MARYAIMVNAGPEMVGSEANGLQYALRLDDEGHEVVVYLDGAATKWPGEIETRPDHPVAEYFYEAVERGILGGACGFCAEAFGGTEGCHEADVTLHGDDGHGPDVGELVTEGYQLVSVG